jgi:hypothetical protein
MMTLVSTWILATCVCAVLGADDSAARQTDTIIVDDTHGSQAQFALPELPMGVLLSSGRLLLVLRSSEEVLVADVALRSATVAARKGAGPGEFRAPSGVWHYSGDSAIVWDAALLRYTVFDDSGQPRRLITPPTVVRGLEPADVSRSGEFVFVQARKLGDSRLTGAVLLWSEQAGFREVPPEVVARRREWIQVERRRPGGGAATFTIPMPFDTEDVVRFGPGRSILLVRSQPYKVDHFGIDRRDFRRGPEIAYPRVPVSQSDRDSVIGEARGKVWQDIEYRWKTNRPPFAAASTQSDHLGRVWVRVEQPQDATRAAYDVLSPNGRVVQVVFTSPSSRVVALSRDLIVVAKRLPDGDYTLRRMPLPHLLR